MPNISNADLKNITGSSIQLHLYRPHPSLADLVQCLWIAKGHGQFQHREESWHATGGSSLLFHFAGQLHIQQTYSNKHSNKDYREQPHGCFFDGAISRSQAVIMAGPLDTLGVRFLPGALHALFPFAIDILQKQTPTLEELEYYNGRQLWQQLAECSSTRQRIDQVNHWLLACRYQRDNSDQLPLWASYQLQQQRGKQSLADLIQNTGLSRRQFERRFVQATGFSPKQMQRLIRVDYLRRHLRKQPHTPLVDLAGEYGFSDQAHLQREFKAIIGVTPGQYRARRSAMTIITDDPLITSVSS